MLIYRVTYAHVDDHQPDETKKHGYAMQEVAVDHEITSDKDLQEIARQIGSEKGYTRVAIMKTELRVEEEDVD